MFSIRYEPLALMISNLAISSLIVRSLPAVVRGGGFAGRAGIHSHGLRFPMPSDRRH
jgi:hypothetical protein